MRTQGKRGAAAAGAEGDEGPVYTEGSAELRTTRLWLARAALPRAAARIEAQRRKRALEEADEAAAEAADSKVIERVRRFENTASLVS